MLDPILLVVVALLPITALMVLLETSPLRGLVLRGIFGSIAAMIYALLGAADVALTEALVGTLLSITLYVIAVRSSLVVKVGTATPEMETVSVVVAELKTLFQKHHCRIEYLAYDDEEELEKALVCGDIHISADGNLLAPQHGVQLVARTRRLHEICDSAQLNHVSSTILKAKTQEQA